MTYSVSEVIEGFRTLSAEDQTKAFLEIEEMWKSSQQNGTQSNAPTRPLTKSN